MKLTSFHRAQSAVSAKHCIALPRPDDQLWIITDGAVRTSRIGATLYVTRTNKLQLAGLLAVPNSAVSESPGSLAK